MDRGLKDLFAKLFSRITESSLMEEDVTTRYVFMVMLAIADPEGYVIGTDIAIARRLNISVSEFRGSRDKLRSPDPDSNSPEEEGRRIVDGDGERGYRIVNFLKYRAMRDENDRRDYMRRYMAEYREKGKPVNTQSLPINLSKLCKPPLAQAEAEAEAEAEPPPSHARVSDFEEFWNAYPKKRGKGDAESAWLLMETELPPISDLLKAVQAAASSEQWEKDNARFIPKPGNWLRDKGWMDVHANGKKQWM